MIPLTPEIALCAIEEQDGEALRALMRRIYPPAYAHYWEDAGRSYLDSQYNQQQFLKDCKQENTGYYFLCQGSEKVGIFRWVGGLPLGAMEGAFLKIHRLYLAPEIQGQGIGKLLMRWAEQLAREQKYSVLWLDVMNKQPQAFEFYKSLGYQYYAHCELNFEKLYKDYRTMSQLYKRIT